MKFILSTHQPVMKRLLLLTTVLVQTLAGHSQQPEFKVYANGLVYSDTTMQQLKHIVDSLNIKFRHCDLNKKYYSAEQGIAHYIDLLSSNAPEAFRDMQQGISFNDFIEKYKLSTIDSNLLLTRTRQKSARLVDIDYYTMHRPDDNYQPDIALCHTPPGAVEEDRYSIKGIKDNWMFDYTKPGNKNVNTRLRAFYIARPLAVTLIPDKYAKLILYSDCMVDTTAGIFYPGAWDDYTSYLFRKDSLHTYARIDAFNNYISRQIANLPEKYHLKISAYKEWGFIDSMQKKYVRDSLSTDPTFRQLLSEAVNEALRFKVQTGDYFEYFTAEYYSKSAALTMKRNRKVFGSCSMDQSPRIHAINIAMLAAETANWEVFLRAHLDVMNDRFERASDGNYAWAARNTYIKEIEDLDIDVQDLMLGISFSAGNAPANHYFGNIGRLGRAFAETKYKKSLEEKLLSMISDSQLDDYNRFRMRCLFLNYTYYLPAREDRLACLQKLEKADKTLPSCITSKIKPDKKVYEQGSARR